MDLGLRGKVALVTAASQGIGLATAHALAREGARLAICARDSLTLQAAADSIRRAHSVSVQAIVCDLVDEAAIASMVKQVLGVQHTIHVLVNNAGGPTPGSFAKLSDDDWQRAFELTLMSAVRTTRAVLPTMRAQRWGRIIIISSYSVKQPIAEIMLSNSLRLAVAGWAKTLATEVARDNVLINSVAPGWIRTDRVTQALAARAKASNISMAEAEAQVVREVPIGRLGRPEEIADAVAFLASERAGFISGTLLPVDGGVVQSPT